MIVEYKSDLNAKYGMKKYEIGKQYYALYSIFDDCYEVYDLDDKWLIGKVKELKFRKNFKIIKK